MISYIYIFFYCSLPARNKHTPFQITSERLHPTNSHALLLKLINDGGCSDSAIEKEPEKSYSWSDWYSETSEKLSDRLIGGSWSSLHTISKWWWRNSIANVARNAKKNMTSAHCARAACMCRRWAIRAKSGHKVCVKIKTKVNNSEFIQQAVRMIQHFIYRT